MKTFSIRTLLSSFLALLPALSFAGDLKPRAEINVRAGTERSILMTEFWAPLAQQSDRVLYGDLRLMGDDGDNREGNLGFGYRQISNRTNSVLGGNIWIDRRRTENGNNFHQLTFGIESLGDKIDMRANGYIQLNSAKTRITPNIGSATPYLSGTGIFYDTNGFIVEEPQDGFDAEVGYRLPILQKHIDATRVYAGGYHFWGDTTDNVTGFRIRTEAQVNSIFSVGARFQHDGPRGSQGFLEATLRFPFKSKKLYQEHGLRSRLDESPERDIDIVTGAKVDTGLMKPVLNASGTTQRILYVDNTNTNIGDGSKDNPFNTLKAAEAALQENDILYINHGDGTTTGMDQGIVINKNNVQLIGSGSTFSYNGFTLLDAKLAPVLTNIQSRIDDYTGNGIFIVADNSYISGITVSSAMGHGIAARAENTTWNSVTINNITSINNIWYGVRVIAATDGHIDNIAVNSNNLSNSTTRGGAIVSAEGGTINTALIENNIANNNATQGIYYQSAASSSAQNVIINNNSVNNNSQNGIYATANGVGSLINLISVNNNSVNSNGNIGIYVQSAVNGFINNVQLDNNASLANNNIGIHVLAHTNSIISRLSLTRNISKNNTGANGYGVWIFAQNAGSSISNIDISDNVITNNFKTGLLLHAASASINSASIERNILSDNRDYGLYLYAQTATSVLNNISASFNDFTNNGVHGIYLRKLDSAAVFNVDFGGGAYGSVGQNRIFGNTGSDLNIDRATNVALGSNWWNNGGAAPTRVTLTSGASAIYAPTLTTDPRP